MGCVKYSKVHRINENCPLSGESECDLWNCLKQMKWHTASEHKPHSTTERQIFEVCSPRNGSDSTTFTNNTENQNPRVTCQLAQNETTDTTCAFCGSPLQLSAPWPSITSTGKQLQQRTHAHYLHDTEI